MEGLGKKILPPISHKTRASAPWPPSSSPSIGRMSFSQRREGTLRRAAGRRSRVAGHHSPVIDPGQTLALLVYERCRRHLSSRCGRQGTAPPIARSGGGEPFCARDGIKRPQPSSQLRLLGQAGVRECRAIGRWRDPSLLRLYESVWRTGAGGHGCFSARAPGVQPPPAQLGRERDGPAAVSTPAESPSGVRLASNWAFSFDKADGPYESARHVGSTLAQIISAPTNTSHTGFVHVPKF